MDRDYKKIFCKKLRELREERGLLQSQVAEKLGCAVSTYANWEQGRREPSVCDIFALLLLFEVDASELFDLKENK